MKSPYNREATTFISLARELAAAAEPPPKNKAKYQQAAAGPGQEKCVSRARHLPKLT